MDLTPEMCVAGRELTEPKLSPRGDEVAFVVRWGASSAIAVVPAGGGPERLLTTWPPPAPGRGLGGGCFDWLPDGSGLVYAGADGELWRQPLPGGRPQQLTALGPDRRAEAPAVAGDGSFVVFVVDQAEVHLVPATAGGPAPRRLDDGSADFCFDPAVSPDGSTVAWQAWDVPAMPWDAARIDRVTLDGHRSSLRPDGAAQQPRWSPSGSLTTVRDDHGWLNVWGEDAPLVAEPFEHAGPSWGTGQRSYAWSPDGRRLAFTRNERGFGRLCVAEPGAATVVDVARGVHGQLTWVGDRLVALRSGARTPTQVVVYDTAGWARTVLAVGPVAGWDAADLPEPELVEVDAGSATVPARRYVAGQGRLICWVHGGPTDQWQVEFLPRVAYWWAQGWDVLVPDPRGSTGHGRRHQQALHGEWGRADVDDTAAVLAHAHRSGWSTPSTTALIGGSSGGLTVLGVLAHHPGLAAGAVVLYPVTDLAGLAERSHRFERHYTVTLVGPLADDDGDHADDHAARSRYRERSPLTWADRIDVPLLVLHGDQDPVVPLEQSTALVERVRDAGGTVELHVFEGEGHGFRRPEHKLAEYRLVGEFLDRHVRAGWHVRAG